MKDKENNQDEEYKELIKKLQELFKNEINEKQSSKIVKTLLGIHCLTIFEAFNLIFREVQIIKTISKNEINSEENMVIYEGKNEDEYETKEFNRVIGNYKIKSDDKNIEESWKPINEIDERRKIKINKNNNIFNYLPIKPEHIKLEVKNKKELYSKNDNEYLYHPLFFKTIMCHYCKIEKNNNKLLCPFSHDIQTDFRIIYDYKNENICKFLNYLYNNKLLVFTNYFNYIPIDQINFNPNLYKVFECPFKECNKDKHLCFFYHSLKEKRRPPLLFRYNIDDKCFDKETKKYKINECSLGIFCNGIHSQNEYNYHPQKFRKETKCTKTKINGHCKFIKTCYGIHPEEEYEIFNKEDNKEKIIEEDEEIKELNGKIEAVNNIANCLKCRKCNKMPKKSKIKYLCECKHFLCQNCFKDIYDYGDKICPFCNKELSKKNYISLNFIPK